MNNTRFSFSINFLNSSIRKENITKYVKVFHLASSFWYVKKGVIFNWIEDFILNKRQIINLFHNYINKCLSQIGGENKRFFKRKNGLEKIIRGL